jgi:hypothetical protein
LWVMFVLTSPSPLEGGEQDPPAPLPLVLLILCWHFQLAPLVQSYSYALFCAHCNNAKKSESTITITSRGEQDLPTPFLALLFVCLCCCIVLAIVVVPLLVQSCSPPHCLFSIGYKNMKRKASTIAFASRGEQDLPNPLGSYCLFVCVDAMCSPLLQLPLVAI